MQITLPRIGTVAAWRQEVRQLAAAGIDPQAVIWSVGTAAPDLFAAFPPPEDGDTKERVARLRRELEELHEKIDALSPPKKPSAGKSDGGERRQGGEFECVHSHKTSLWKVA